MRVAPAFSIFCLALLSLLGLTPAFQGSSCATSRNSKASSLNVVSELPDVKQHKRVYTSKKFPKLIVLGLDNTVWSPELNTLRHKLDEPPKADRDVMMYPGAKSLIATIRKSRHFPSTTKFAIASTTHSRDWAYSLLEQFRIRDMFDFVEISPGSKVQHFEVLKQRSGVSYDEMLFFDDSRDGHCELVADLGVLSVHCPAGLETRAVWEKGLQAFLEWDSKPNTIVDLLEMRHQGKIKNIEYEKGYGFIQRSRRSRDLFFSFRDLPNGVSPSSLKVGDTLQFTKEPDAQSGKFRAGNIELLQGASTNKDDHVTMPVFSKNQPFAALLANGYIDLESRNGTMFKAFPQGTQMLLHVGHRTYPDGGRHLDIMINHEGMSDKEVKLLKSLPKGFDKGMAVAIVEIGKTYELTTDERSTREMQKRIGAFGCDSGRYVTEIAKVSYLKYPCFVKAQQGVFEASIPPDALPDDWELAEDLETSVSLTKHLPNKENQIRRSPQNGAAGGSDNSEDKEKLAELQREIDQISKELAQAESERDIVKTKLDRALAGKAGQEKIVETTKALVVAAEQREALLKADYELLQEENAKLRAQLSAAVGDHQNAIDEARAALREHNSNLESLRDENAELSTQLATADEEHRVAIEEARATLLHENSRVTRLQAKVKALSSTIEAMRVRHEQKMIRERRKSEENLAHAQGRHYRETQGYRKALLGGESFNDRQSKTGVRGFLRRMFRSKVSQ